MADHGFATFAAAKTGPTAAALTATLGLAAACWGIAVWQMNGMDMGAATRLGSFAFFIAVLVLAQKLLPVKAAVDVPLALAIAGFGIWIVAAPSSVPGLVPAM